MNISPVVKLAALGGLAVGAFGSALLIGSHHDATPAQIVVRQDAATSSLSAPAAAPSSSAVPARVTPSVAGASTVVVKKPAVQPQEVAPVTDPTPSTEPTPTTDPTTAPAESNPYNLPSGYPTKPYGNGVGSTAYNPYPDPTSTAPVSTDTTAAPPHHS